MPEENMRECKVKKYDIELWGEKEQKIDFIKKYIIKRTFLWRFSVCWNDAFSIVFFVVFYGITRDLLLGDNK